MNNKSLLLQLDADVMSTSSSFAEELRKEMIKHTDLLMWKKMTNGRLGRHGIKAVVRERV